MKKYIEEYLNKVPAEYLVSSATLSLFKDNPKLAMNILNFLDINLRSKERFLDLGCGYGYLTIFFKNFLGFKSAYGIDIDRERIRTSERMGITTYCLDLENDPLPFTDNSFSFVVAAGIFNHLKFWDNTLLEANRVLEPRGLFFISNPNMAWWVDRISLFLGYQPSAIEVSKIYSVNLPPFYPRRRSIGYVHSLTLKGMIDLISLYNFKCLKIFPNRIPKRDLDLKTPKIPLIIKYLVRAIDSISSISPSLSIRLLIIAEKMATYNC